jgi:hypothetical protein
MLALTARAKIQSPMLLLLTSSLSLSEVFVTAMTMMMRFCCVVGSRKLELALDARNWKCFTKSPKYKEKALREKLLKKKKKKSRKLEISLQMRKAKRASFWVSLVRAHNHRIFDF